MRSRAEDPAEPECQSECQSEYQPTDQGTDHVELLSDRQFHDLLAFRTALREFERWSTQRAGQEGLTSAQHQLLLAVRGHPDPRGPTIGQVADYLLIRHHSAVGLVDRVEAAGLILRERDDPDGRVVRLRLSRRGLDRIRALTRLHLEELRRLAHLLDHL